MKWSFFSTSWEGAIKANVALSLAVGIQSVLLAGSLYLNFVTRNDINVTLTPAVIEEKLVIGKTTANEAYIKSFGLFIATLLGNITSGNANFIVDMLSLFIDSSAYPQIRTTILSMAETRAFKEAAGATKFNPSSITYEASTRKVFVTGTVTMLTSVGESTTKSIIYEMELRIVDRNPKVFALQTYPGNVPHTALWLKDHPVQTVQEAQPN